MQYAPHLRRLFALTAIALVADMQQTEAQSTQVGARLGANYWSRPTFERYEELYQSTSLSPQSEIFLRREGRRGWVKEWSIGVTRYHQNARFAIFDGPDHADFDVVFIEPTFSLFRSLSSRLASGARLKTHLGLTASLGASRVRARWTGFSDGVGAVDGTR